MTTGAIQQEVLVAVDCVVFGLDETDLKVLLIERGIKPFEGRWALPGGFLLDHESVEDAARRELAEETGLEDVFLEQLYTFSDRDRDPRGRVVSVAHFALVRLDDYHLEARTDARSAAWFSVSNAPGQTGRPGSLPRPELAFDHQEILDQAVARLRGKVRYQPIGFELLPEKFTLTQLQRLYETILEKAIDKRNFRRKILAMDLLVDLDEVQQAVAHRAARLYSFDRSKYEELSRAGFNFEI